MILHALVAAKAKLVKIAAKKQCDGTMCPGGCCPEVDWFCCPGMNNMNIHHYIFIFLQTTCTVLPLLLTAPSSLS